MNAINWPPCYSIKKSTRARHVKLKICHRNGLQIVTPSRFNQKDIPLLLEKNRAWIEKKLLALLEQTKKQMDLPNEIHFTALNQTWRVCYLKTDSKKIQLVARPTKELVLHGNTDDLTSCKKLLVLWVRKQAEIHLALMLKMVSLESGLNYNRITVRNQQTRWGSCSMDKTISLNYKLIFLPEHLMRHILIHELCHTVHMDHSTKFWKLVASFDREWEGNNRAMRKTDVYIPAWLL